MKVQGRHWRSVWLEDDGSVGIIDQRALPHHLQTRRLASSAEAERAIREMWIRGAPLIGAVAAYGIALAMREDASDAGLAAAHARLLATRPTAVNLRWALDRMSLQMRGVAPHERAERAFREADALCDEDVAINQAIGRHGLALIEDAARRQPGRRVNILTHCNAGWLATVDWGTATAPIYQAFDAGIDVHVWVDETRPRNQGASITAWELGQHGVPHTLIVDNAGGHLMQRGEVDLCIVGTDRVSANGDVCNKIGTYLKALAAFDNGVPFYVALPSPTLDLSLFDGVKHIPIENRDGSEISHVTGLDDEGQVRRVRIVAPGTSCATNPGFDVTPARLVTALITEHGLCGANPHEISTLFKARTQAP